jgi:hypothetical protein
MSLLPKSSLITQLIIDFRTFIVKHKENQRVLPMEVLIADDGSREETTILIQNFKQIFQFL